MLNMGIIIGERYEVVGCIGSGGMADVYKAKDHKLNRFVAMKVLKPEFSADTNFIRKFQREAQAAAGLAHPNVVNVFDVGEDKGINYIVMELVEGITLKDYISKKGKLTVKEATSIAIQVSMGLEAAHNRNIVHRDIKPQNIIISTDGKVKVTDFGIARVASSNTISTNAMGSVHYSSPEQVRGGYSDFKSDIYSLGITMYEMVTGRVPFDGDTTVAIAIKHLQDEMVPPSQYVAELPHSLEEIILNIILLMPAGFLLPFVCNRPLRWTAGLTEGLLLSGCIEGLQLLLGRGLFEFDDILHNSIGCMTGCMIAGFIINRFRRK